MPPQMDSNRLNKRFSKNVGFPEENALSRVSRAIFELIFGVVFYRILFIFSGFYRIKRVIA